MDSLFTLDAPMPDSDFFPLADLELEKEIESIAIAELDIQQMIEEDEANLFGFNELAMFVAALPEKSEPQLQELTKELTTESNGLEIQLTNLDDPINDSIPILQNDPTTYKPNTVVDFPLINSKWCCKCDWGPPTCTIDDTIVKCTVCNKHWGCRTCYDIETVEHDEKKEEIVRCPECEVTKVYSRSRSDTISSQSAARQTPTISISENPISRSQSFEPNGDHEPVQHQMVSYINASHPQGIHPVIIFNFDDTLFPTTKYNEISARPDNDGLAQWGCKGIHYKFESIEERAEWHTLSATTLELLELYIEKYGKRHICIASSSNKEWIKHALLSVRTVGFYGNIYELLFGESTNLTDDKITIYHPEPNFPHTDQMLAKIMYQKANRSENVLNTFVVIGDTIFSDEAATHTIEYMFGKNSKNVFVDRYKLEPKPTISTLAREQRFLKGLCGEKHFQINALVRHKAF